MKKIFFALLLSIPHLAGFSQRITSKTLFFYQDSTSFQGCGVIKSVDILYFVSDTANDKGKKSEYYVAILCAESYGDAFFKKGHKYRMQLSKDYSKIRPYIPASALKPFIKEKNFFVASKIKTIQ